MRNFVGYAFICLFIYLFFLAYLLCTMFYVLSPHLPALGNSHLRTYLRAV